MDRQILEQLINSTIKRIFEEYELRNTAFLNALYRNIDILASHAKEWFGSTIPSEYRGVVSALTTLAYMYLQEKADYSKAVVDPVYNEVDCFEVMVGVSKDIAKLFSFKKIRIQRKGVNTVIRTSRTVLKESLYNIFLTVLPFTDETSSCTIRFDGDVSSVRATMSFRGLKETLPDTGKLSKIFFSYVDNGEYHVSIGFNSSLESLKDIGAIARIESLSSPGELGIVISFPSTAFLNTVETMRTPQGEPKVSGEMTSVLLCTDDFIIEMFLREELHDNGFNTRKIGLKDFDNASITEKAAIIDYSSLRNEIADIRAFIGSQGGNCRIIIIHDSDQDPAAEIGYDSLVCVKKPFDIDKILIHLKKD